MNTSARLTEGRKSDILKILSQLHAYLSRYDDLEKAETRFEQRMKDAGCSDMYAVIDEVLDVVDTAKKPEKIKLLTKIYKQYFPKAAKAEPASDEDMESAMDSHHLDGIGEDEAESAESAPSDKQEAEDTSSDGQTLGDVRKPEEEYIAKAKEEREADEEDKLIEESIRAAKRRTQKMLESDEFEDDDFEDDSISDDDDENFEDEDFNEADLLDDNLDDDDLGDVDDFEAPYEPGGKHQRNLSGSMTDEAHEFIADLKMIDPEITDEEIIEAIVEEFSPRGEPMEHGMASDILEEYYTDTDPTNEEATEGDIEDAAENLIAEGFSIDDVLDKLSRRFGLSRHEVEMIVGDLGHSYDDKDTPVDDEQLVMEDTVEEEEGENRLPFNRKREMVGPKDQGGSPAPVPNSPAPTSYSTTPSDTSADLAPSSSKDNEMMPKTPEVAELFQALGKVRPEDLQKLSQTFAENADDIGDVSSFEKPKPRSPKAAHPAAMDVVKDICAKIGHEPKFINSGARGYQVRLGIPQILRKVPMQQHDAFRQLMAGEVKKLQKKLDDAGYPEIKASAVGSIKDTLAFLVPYEASLYESALSPAYARAANQVQKRLLTGQSPDSVRTFLKNKYSFSDSQIDNILQYVTLQSVR